ncbi:hypothetical protein P4O66_020824 [Electrophorus voltai]|uniref:Uncharacterized protein n=1 Tax=Electrophorus voltai TaxID=2609070 RepID=A0AAD8ZQQ5_9TELE|nr:hypothetical protein P4O66_020824 [Electrophorus voltai]
MAASYDFSKARSLGAAGRTEDPAHSYSAVPQPSSSADGAVSLDLSFTPPLLSLACAVWKDRTRTHAPTSTSPTANAATTWPTDALPRSFPYADVSRPRRADQRTSVTAGRFPDRPPQTTRKPPNSPQSPTT